MQIYTIEEAAQQLRKSQRWLESWLRAHPVDSEGRPFYSPLGRSKTFDDSDLARIREAAREEERVRLAGPRAAAVRRQVAEQPRAPLAEALALFGEREQAKRNKVEP